MKDQYKTKAQLISELEEMRQRVSELEQTESEQVKAKTVLRAEKEFTDTALDTQLDTFFLFDPSTNKAIRWNQTFKEISGYTDEEIARMPAPASYYSSNDLKKAEIFTQKVLKEGSGTIELELICKDGRKVPTEYRVSVINDDQGAPKYIISIGRDITERLQVEEALRESEGRGRQQRTAIVELSLEEDSVSTDLQHSFEKVCETLSETINVARTSVWKLSDDGLELRCLNLYEADKNEHSHGMVLNAQDIPKYFNAIKAESRIYAEDVQNDPRTNELTENYLKPLGITSMLDAGVVIDGNLVGVVCSEHVGKMRKWHSDEESFVSTIAAFVAQIIVESERAQAEEAMRESEANLSKAQEIAHIGSWEWDLILNEVKWSDELFRILGFEPNEVNPSFDLWTEMIHPSDVEKSKEFAEKTMQGEKDVSTEYRIVRKDKSIRHIFARGASQFDNENNPVKMHGIVQDITERVQAEKALQESERKYRQLFENMTSGFAVHEMIYDDQGKPVDYRYLEINPAFEKLTGVPVDVLLGKTVKEIMPNTEDYWIETSAKVAMTGEPTAYVNFSRELDKYYDTYLFSSEKDTFAVVFNDVTEKIKAQEEVQKLNEELKERIYELEAKNAELERFTYTVSHDLKSPLITINGFIGYLEEDASSGNMERLRGDIQRIQGAVEKMQRLLDELLELSRIGRLMNPPELVAFEEIVREVLDNVHGQLEERGVAVTLSPDLPTVYGDRQRLVEVLQNLVDNAAKCMGEQSDPQIEIGQRGEEDSKPVFYVKDNGIGIAPEYHKKIFGLFEKLDAKSEGTGIGLALVKRIVEFHGGRIWVESEVGKGATFYFTLKSGEAEF